MRELWETLCAMADGISDNIRIARRLADQWPEGDREQFAELLGRARDMANELNAWAQQADMATAQGESEARGDE